MRILFLHTGGLGDIILLSPALRLLRQQYPEEHITLLTESRASKGAQELFGPDAPDVIVNEVQSFDFKGQQSLFSLIALINLLKGYDTVIASGSSPLIAILLWLSGARQRIGYQSRTDFLLTHKITLNKQQYTSDMLAGLVSPLINNKPANLQPALPGLKDNIQPLLNEPYILIHPGVSQLSIQKQIYKSPDKAFWQELIQSAQEKYPHLKIALAGGPDDQEVIKEIREDILFTNNIVDYSEQNLSLKDLASLISYSKVFICVDSAPMHLAVALETQTIALFTGTNPAKLLPANTNNIQAVYVENLLCRPCLWDKRIKSCTTPLCVYNLKAKDVLEKMESICPSVK